MTRSHVIPLEFALAAKCCVWPRSAASLADIARCAQGVADWDGFLEVLHRHRIHGLVHDAFKLAGVEAPAGVSEQLAAAAQTAALNGLRLAAETVRLYGLLHAGGVATLVLKGATLDVLAYDRRGLKSAWDIDLLVLPEQVEAAIPVLAAAGYQMTLPAGLNDAQFRRWRRFDKEALYVNGEIDAYVELHWSVSETPGVLGMLRADAPSQEIVILPGANVRTFETEALVAYLCVHGAHHGWSRLKWLSDVAALIGSVATPDVEALYDSAGRFGAQAAMSQALLLCRLLFGTPLPARLEVSLMADRRARWLANIGLSTLLLGSGREELRPRTFAQDRINLSHFALGDSPGHIWRQAGQKMRSAHDAAALPLPSGFDFAYPLLRAPLALWRRLRRGP